ncbi:MAG: phospho-N-acetylmuramoyl-pentapeptide-transferase [Peptoniphilus harei]|uniref:phospho-N-acetylmuramoyl-pentapeptide- transferase n=1 Tax=Peptoniphilus harei TaxID=54005 RepID=UPI00254C49D5|nr:phospho-N-acetylmuramoyl-pentapeptide-transferase [Peptoniphilus harei]MDK7755283.1 phospho-N-acetylmuramoyl-pentapeptide-transferase [Peptoniphilus harei]MDK7761517.1 phospho-N-acetylmuramoyl-pentapeptide-transferase [Peptoniphilus harei]MDK8271043.1 phospho-N-acetylmuramoyl-pentapeptide-transferase [Peptoniphilus harei]MDK8339369.1 phospho-N-acetylmuramoyl-pentapeptide-transferase [Peptoniphilus harei]MDU5323440.1 phospho-N-acetylmuramoyl-pentapeptide-transferase [Peptoniphilus harei]
MNYLINIGLGFVLSIVLGRLIIPILKRLHAGQSIREDGPQSHLVKSGTPTIGGLIFLASVIITSLVTANFKLSVLMILFSTLAFGAVGFIDDYIKVVMKRNLGLRAYQKLLLQILVAVILIIYQYNSKEIGTDLYIPFLKDYRSIGFLYIPFVIFVIVGTVNSVNLTDGLDGLSSSVTIICLIFFNFVAIKFQRYEIAGFCLALSGALMGFLHYNKFPAKVFMGDTGSLALGGAISAIALLLNVPLILPIAGGIYFIETLSVIIQVVSFKTRGKRVFLMSPLHHHFEHKGWHEKKIVAVFSLVEVILCVISYLILF